MTLAAAFLLFLCAPVSAVESAAGLGAGPVLVDSGKKGPVPDPVTRLGLAVSLVFPATTWTAVGVSTRPANAASALIRQGHYRLELLQLMLMARDCDGRLAEFTKKRAEGAALRVLAEGAGLSYDAVYLESQRLAGEVERRLRELERVRVGDPAGTESEPDRDPPKPKRGKKKK